MAEKRLISTKLFFDPDFMRLSSHTIRLIMVAIILFADDYGRGYAHAETLGRLCDFDVADMEQAFKELGERKIIQLYQVEGHHYYWVCNWQRDQKLKYPARSFIPPAPGEMTTTQAPQ